MDDERAHPSSTDTTDDGGDATGGEPAPEQPEFGPGGYLPDRASRRARKIILRAPLGLQWVIGSLVVGVVVVVAGWLALRDPAPAAPFTEVPRVVGEQAVVHVPDLDMVATGAGGRPRAFVWQEGTDLDLAYCEESGLLEATGDRAWRVTGRGVNGTPSLVPYRTAIHDGRFYVDPTTTLEPLTPDPDRVETACT